MVGEGKMCNALICGEPHLGLPPPTPKSGHEGPGFEVREGLGKRLELLKT